MEPARYIRQRREGACWAGRCRISICRQRPEAHRRLRQLDLPPSQGRNEVTDGLTLVARIALDEWQVLVLVIQVLLRGMDDDLLLDAVLGAWCGL
jgi:hypothetical protein